jgi:hypothetical protein
MSLSLRVRRRSAVDAQWSSDVLKQINKPFTGIARNTPVLVSLDDFLSNRFVMIRYQGWHHEKLKSNATVLEYYWQSFEPEGKNSAAASSGAR